MNTHLINKINHINNKVNCIENIFFVHADDDYLSDEIYAIEIELKDKVSKKFKNQFIYLKKYINKYNKRHNTNYTISIYSDEC
jgi:hypothetical protein